MRHSVGKLYLLVCVALITGTAGIWPGQATGATDALTLPFDPGLEVTVSNPTAASSPESLKINIKKPYNHCLDYLSSTSYCLLSDTDSSPGEVDAQQDFKSISITLPPGVAPDINSVETCEPDQQPDLDPANPPVYVKGEPGPLAWSCPGDAKVGEFSAISSDCSFYIRDNYYMCPEPGGLSEKLYFGELFLGSARQGEQARLMALVSYTDIMTDVTATNVFKIEIGVNVSSSGRITVTTEDLPDAVFGVYSYSGDDLGWKKLNIPAQFSEIDLAVDGSASSLGNGRTLLENPTSCGARTLDASIQGYAKNVEFEDFRLPPIPGSGEGKTVSLSAGYPVTGCNSLPYNPQLSFALESSTPGAPTGLTATLTQQHGEQTTGSVSVVFPTEFGINIKGIPPQCSDQQWSEKSCPAESAIGAASADSYLLPEGIAGVSGNVYLGPVDLASGRLKLFMNLANSWLPNGIDVLSEASVSADGVLSTTFSDLPELPIDSFTLQLNGGSQAILVNPEECGAYQISAKLHSHQGFESITAPSVKLPCGEASLKVDMSTKRPKSHPVVEIETESTGIGSLAFKLPSALKVRKKMKTGVDYGDVIFDTANGRKSADLKYLRSSTKGQYKKFSAVADGAQMAELTLYHKMKQSKKAKKKSKKKSKKKYSLSSEKVNLIAFTDVPDGTTEVSLELDGEKNKFLTLPSSCKVKKVKNFTSKTKKSKKKSKKSYTYTRRKLEFLAAVTDIEGTKMKPEQEIKMSCSGKKSKKKSKK